MLNSRVCAGGLAPGKGVSTTIKIHTHTGMRQGLGRTALGTRAGFFRSGSGQMCNWRGCRVGTSDRGVRWRSDDDGREKAGLLRLVANSDPAALSAWRLWHISLLMALLHCGMRANRRHRYFPCHSLVYK